MYTKGLTWGKGQRHFVVDDGHFVFASWDAHKVVPQHAADFAVACLKEQVARETQLLAATDL